MRHGAEPWDELAVKLMLKWPNLYYSTSAFAPRYYPEPIVDYANTRGADKVMYAGYFPMGLSLERIFSELPERRLQGRRLAEVPPRERRAGVRAGRADVSRWRRGSRSPCRSAGSASASPTTSPIVDAKAGVLLGPAPRHLARRGRRAARARRLLPAPRRPPRPRRHRRATAASPARSTAGVTTPRAPTSRSRTPTGSTARPGSGRSRPSSATASPSPGTTPTRRSRRCGRCPSSRSSRATHPEWSTLISTSYEIDTTLAGDGRERRRLRALPVRAQHGDGAGARLATRPASRSPPCGRRRSSRHRAASWKVASTRLVRPGPVDGVVQRASSTR